MLKVHIVTICVLSQLITLVHSHGRLMKPLSRNAMWRYGFGNPVNYNDNELYCGGFIVQYNQNGGKCGVCGDNWVEEVPRKHEAGGLYGNGILGGVYNPGQVINIESELTTNHKGWFEIKLCVNDDRSKIITQDCLDENLLPIIGEGNVFEGTRFIIPKDSKKSEWFKWKVKLPDVTCTHCVLQWKYFAGNTWGKCKNGTVSVGCGSQETFINCADVTIKSQTPTYTKTNNLLPEFRKGVLTGNDQTPPSSLDNLQAVVRAQTCHARDKVSAVPGLNLWCFKNCLKVPPECPEEICICPTDCTAIGDFANITDSDVWCHQHCLRNPSFCPRDKCSCV